jgi:hypothetical protein
VNFQIPIPITATTPPAKGKSKIVVGLAPPVAVESLDAMGHDALSLNGVPSWIGLETNVQIN